MSIIITIVILLVLLSFINAIYAFIKYEKADELDLLNIIWSEYNNSHDVEYTKKMLDRYTWKHCKKDVQLLKKFVFIEEATKK